MTKTFQYFALIGLFSVLLASGITVNTLALTDQAADIAKLKANPFAKTIIETENLIATIQPFYTTYGDPADYLTAPGGALDGTGLLV